MCIPLIAVIVLAAGPSPAADVGPLRLHTVDLPIQGRWPNIDPSIAD